MTLMLRLLLLTLCYRPAPILHDFRNTALALTCPDKGTGFLVSCPSCPSMHIHVLSALSSAPAGRRGPSHFGGKTDEMIICASKGAPALPQAARAISRLTIELSQVVAFIPRTVTLARSISLSTPDSPWRPYGHCVAQRRGWTCLCRGLA